MEEFHSNRRAFFFTLISWNLEPTGTYLQKGRGTRIVQRVRRAPCWRVCDAARRSVPARVAARRLQA